MSKIVQVKVTKCNAFGDEFKNLTPGSIHELVAPPDGEDNSRGVWVMGVNSKVLLLHGEFEYIVHEGDHMPELTLPFGPTVDQQGFNSQKWGLLTFHPTKDDSWAHNCKLCILLRSEECDHAPCSSNERNDGKRGYYSIHNMPKR